MADLSWLLVMRLDALLLLWTAPALQFALVLVFLYRRIFLRKFPAFFAYTSFSVAATVLQISVIHQQLLYFWVYWIDQAIYGVLALLAVRDVFQMIWDMKQGRRRFLVWGLILALAIASVWWGDHQRGQRHPLAGVEAAFDAFVASIHVVEMLLCGLAIWLVRRLTRYHLGIMLGFGVSAISQVPGYVSHFYHLGPAFRQIVVYAPVSAYIGAAGTWLFTFASRPKVNTSLHPDEVIEWIDEQERIARKISAGLGLKWPRKERENGDKRCAVV